MPITLSNADQFSKFSHDTK